MHADWIPIRRPGSSLCLVRRVRPRRHERAASVEQPAPRPMARLMPTSRKSVVRAVAFFVWAIVCGAPAGPLSADEDTGQAVAAPESTTARSEVVDSITRHKIAIGGAALEYGARVGAIDIATGDRAGLGRIFFVAYRKIDADPETRPLSFVFNGGPGAASAYLHLLALGPWIVGLDDDGSIPRPPVRMAENPLTWLTFTDLVFIDPVGTGFSQAVDAGKPDERGEAGERRFWSFEQDLDAIAEFIRLYLTRTQRWRSPKFLVGESYGGFRAAALPKRLASEPGVRVNGIILISPVLEFGFQQFDPYRVLPWASVLPAYAATALHHGKSAVTDSVQEALAQVEALATGPYLTWLAAADDRGSESVAEALAGHLGLPRQLIIRYGGRIPRRVFAKMLLRDSRRVVSLYDGTITGIDPHPAAPVLQADDPVLEGLTAPLTSAFNSYIREQLAFETELPYMVLNPAVSREWDWASATNGGRNTLGTAESLREAMSLDGHLMVLVAHGIYDLVTPYLASKLIIRQMRLDPAIRPNLSFRIYEGGHMPYTHRDARAAFRSDARDFFRRATASADRKP